MLAHEAEILNRSPIDWTAPSWTRSTLTHEQVIKWTKAKVYAYQILSFALGRCRSIQKRTKDGNINSKNFDSPIITENHLEFEWNIFPGLTSLEILQKIQKDLQNQNIEPVSFEERIIFMSMFNDIDWTKRGNSERCTSNSEHVKSYAERFSRGHWTFLGPGDEKKWHGTLSHTHAGQWHSIAT